ncbi:phage tail tube protein [Chelativorans sp. YIM 93263]|uniref:phage tail tube protein n=1 Tax=Chelativorans sp. YIM 93263 TaxID=2906648 RepID=UPI00237808B9|nr:phage tail tube protein [Chelativorans sp. YIM 93263]
MSTVLGRLLILRRPTEQPAPDDWENVCGINTTNFRILNDIVETKKANCTDRAQPPIRVRKYGGQDFSFSGSGVFEDEPAGKLLADAAKSQTVLSGWCVHVPGYGDFVGDWVLANFDFSGDLDNDMNFSSEVQAAGEITYTAL